MPRVPTYDALTIPTTSQPVPRFDSQPAVTTIGDAPNVPDYAGRQTQMAGQAIEGAGLAFDRALLDMQREANQLRVDDVLNKTKEDAMRLTFDKDVGFVNQRGISALERESGKPLAVEYADTLKEKISGYADTLGNDAQRRAYMMRANDMVTQLRGQAIKHESDEFRTYAMSVREGTIKTRINEIGLNYNNPEVIDQAVSSITASVYDMAKLSGKSATWADAEARKMTSNAHLVAIGSAMEKGDVAYADSYLKKYGKQIEADDILRVQGTIGKDLDARVGLGVANNVMGSVGSRIVTQPIDRAWNVSVRNRPKGSDASSDAAMGVMPVIGGEVRPSSNFGPRRNPFTREMQNHDGVDFAAPEGSSIVASMAGVVKRVGKDPKGYGNFIEIEHEGGVVTRYAHASGISAKEGQEVNAGDPIGAVGSTGKSTGPHLHFEVLRDGKAVDPTAFLQSGGRAKAEFTQNLKDFDNDISKAFAASHASPKTVRDAMKKAEKENDDEGYWLSYLPKDTQDSVKKSIKEYGAGMGEHEKPTLQQVHNQVRMQLGPNTSPQRLKIALDESTRQFNEATAAVKQREDETVAEVQRNLISTGGDMNALPFALKAAIPPGKFDDILSFAGKVSGNVPIKTDWELFYNLKNNPQALLSANLMAVRDKLGDAEFKNLTEEQKTLKDNVAQGKGDLSTDVRPIKDVLNNLMIQAGVDPSPKDDDKTGAEKVGKIYMAFEGIVKGREKTLGRKMTPDELQKAASEMFTKVETYGYLWNSKTVAVLVGPGDEVVVPKGEREQIITALRQAKKPVTDDAIEFLYRQRNGIVPKKAK